MYLKYSTRSLGGVVSTIVHTTSSAVSTSGHLGVLLRACSVGVWATCGRFVDRSLDV